MKKYKKNPRRKMAFQDAGETKATLLKSQDNLFSIFSMYLYFLLYFSQKYKMAHLFKMVEIWKTSKS
jgi:hypothetical protein